MKRLALSLSALALVAGCQTNPITGRTQLMIVTEEMTLSSSSNAYAQTLQQARSKGQLDGNVTTSRRISNRGLAGSRKPIWTSTCSRWR